jgi:hypothetical protein
MRKILEDNPLVTEMLQKWFTEKMKKAVEGGTLSEELKKSFMAEVISIEKLAPIMEVNPRSLFDFFDESYIHILPIMNGGMFSATINGDPISLTVFVPMRIAAETRAVEEAFPILEKILENE